MHTFSNNWVFFSWSRFGYIRSVLDTIFKDTFQLRFCLLHTGLWGSLDKQVQLAIIGTNNFPLSNVCSPYSYSSSTVLNRAQRVFVSDPLQQLQGHDHRNTLLHRRRARRNLQDVRPYAARQQETLILALFLCLLLRRGVAAPWTEQRPVGLWGMATRRLNKTRRSNKQKPSAKVKARNLNKRSISRSLAIYVQVKNMYASVLKHVY